ncbi:hypothetical protein GDO81_000559 [Engystomops pustulosus]|uniref:Ig-like domain-containing protein n=1 Tax=Engystomops pustulosus TaxID=76066 RepID=A0AAV7D773_ENGPU|nr:hypothetical protein GDO81_000559 [Engystomops pustulosus]
MANRALDKALPVLITDVYPNETKTESLSESMSEASSHDSFYDSLSDLHGETIDGNVPELSAFLNQEEMNKSLDIAREAFSSHRAVDPAQGHVLSPHTKQPDRSVKELKLSNSTSDGIRRRDNGPNKLGRAGKPEPSNVRGMISPFLTTSPSIIRALQAQKASKHYGKGGYNTLPIPKARAKSINKDINAQSDMCQKAANFIEELSAIFRETNKARDKRSNGDSSSPDSGYLSPKQENTIIINPTVNESETEKQKRWFCEGRELHNSPDIIISSEGDGLHVLVIAEAFEDDTGRYTCVASNPLGSDTSSAEIFVEGASSSDSEGEGFSFNSKQGTMPQAQKKTTSVSLTIGPSSPKCGITTAIMQPISIPVQQIQSPTSYLYRQDGSSSSTFSPPSFTKELQSLTSSEGQVVVLECRVKGTPPVNVKWFRQGTEIQDSPDFRILQKSKRKVLKQHIC